MLTVRAVSAHRRRTRATQPDAAYDSAVGGGARSRFCHAPTFAVGAGAFPLSQPAGVTRSGNSRLCLGKLSIRPWGARGAIDLMKRIKAEFVYEIGATTASTTPPMSFALRRGVCQDFSHVMISGMRGLGCRRPMSAAICARAAGGAKRCGRRCDACLGVRLVRQGGGLDRTRPDQCCAAPKTMWCWQSAATMPTLHRSTA